MSCPKRQGTKRPAPKSPDAKTLPEPSLYDCEISSMIVTIPETVYDCEVLLLLSLKFDL